MGALCKAPKAPFQKTLSATVTNCVSENLFSFLYGCAHDCAVHREAVLRTQADGDIYGAIYGRMYGPICGTIHHYGAASGRLRRPPTVLDSIVVDGATYVPPLPLQPPRTTKRRITWKTIIS